MRTTTKRLSLMLLLLICGVFGFALWSHSQNKMPRIFYVNVAEEKAQRAGKSFSPPATVEEELMHYDFITLSSVEFNDIVSNSEKAILEKDSESTWIAFPGKKQAMYSLSKNGPTVDEYIKWAQENNIEELYFFYAYTDPDTKFEPIIVPENIEKFINPLNVIQLFTPLDAFAHQGNGPNCTSGSSVLEGYTVYQTYPKLDSQCPAQSGSAGRATVNIIFKYDTRYCHWSDIAFHIHYNIYDEFAESGLINCMNDENSSSYSLFMCNPHNLTIKMFNGISHPEWTCGGGNNNDYDGCASISDYDWPPPLTTDDYDIELREGKFRSNKSILRHELQHTFGYEHGPGPGSCGSFGNTYYEKTCCQNSFD